jgi:hypothetical protein
MVVCGVINPSVFLSPAEIEIEGKDREDKR